MASDCHRLLPITGSAVLILLAMLPVTVWNQRRRVPAAALAGSGTARAISSTTLAVGLDLLILLIRRAVTRKKSTDLPFGGLFVVKLFGEEFRELEPHDPLDRVTLRLFNVPA